jgi:hypothetical protein
MIASCGPSSAIRRWPTTEPDSIKLRSMPPGGRSPSGRMPVPAPSGSRRFARLGRGAEAAAALAKLPKEALLRASPQHGGLGALVRRSRTGRWERVAAKDVYRAAPTT